MSVKEWQKQKTLLAKRYFNLRAKHGKLLKQSIKAGKFPKSFSKIKADMQKAEIKLKIHLAKKDRKSWGYGVRT
jgi:hypothetical protein